METTICTVLKCVGHRQAYGLIWHTGGGDKPRTPTLYLNLSNKVYNIKTGRLELAKGFDVLHKDHAVSRGRSKR